MHGDEQTVLGLLRKLLAEAYWDTEYMHSNRARFLIDGCTYDVTTDELAALERWLNASPSNR